MKYLISCRCNCHLFVLDAVRNQTSSLSLVHLKRAAFKFIDRMIFRDLLVFASTTDLFCLGIQQTVQDFFDRRFHHRSQMPTIWTLLK